MNTSNQYKTILCVDDDADDIMLIKQAIHTIDSNYGILEAHDGVQAMDLLDRLNKRDALPCLIVLDINMPRKNGMQTLLEIQENISLSAIPVVLFTTSSSYADKHFSLTRNVELVTKPIHFPHFVTTARKFLSYCNSGVQG